MNLIALRNIRSVKQNRIFLTLFFVALIHLLCVAIECIHDFGSIFGMSLYTKDKLTFYVTSFDIKLTLHYLEMKVAFFDFFCVCMSCWMISFCFCTL